MANPQSGIFALGTRSHHHLQFDLTGDPRRLVPAITRMREAATTVAGVNLVIGFGQRAWSRIAPDLVPDGLVDFEPIVGSGGFEIPAAQHDLWLWLHGAGTDAVFDMARLATSELEDLAVVAAEQSSFAYRASMDLTGFEDGTENPTVDEAPAVATVPAGRPGAGASIVLVQRWVHDLDRFEALEPADRELVIGRTLQGSIELDETVQSPRSHVSRVVIEDESGEELQIFRRSTAFGGVQENGLMFVAFSADLVRLQRMLVRMSGRDDAMRDRLTEFSRPVASAWYVAPAIEHLRELEGTGATRSG